MHKTTYEKTYEEYTMNKRNRNLKTPLGNYFTGKIIQYTVLSIILRLSLSKKGEKDYSPTDNPNSSFQKIDNT